MQRTYLNRFFFLYPLFMIPVTLGLLSSMVIYAAVPLALFSSYALQWLAQQVLTWAPSDMRHIHKTVSSGSDSRSSFTDKLIAFPSWRIRSNLLLAWCKMGNSHTPKSVYINISAITQLISN